MARLRRELARVKRERDFLKDAGSSLPGIRRAVCHDGALCQSLSDPHDVSAAPGLSPSRYYASHHRPLRRRARENAQLIQEIRRIHAESDGAYGSPKLWQE